ncbi:hypothetical protein RIR_jg29739.t3 [Rhizophagus irregularis DAOM 181602=DAOM 197198]|nr:hypothetical protein RIR_jg29739.t3 [Rhizophagus irregularis DAOM 181602=DAOM 197198]
MGILVETTHRTLDNKVSGKRRERIRLGGLPTNGKPRFVSFGWASEEGKPRNQDSIGCSEERENSKIHSGGLPCSEERENSKDSIWRASEERKIKKPRFVSKIWRASEERKTKKPRFVRSGGLPKNENPKIRSGGLPKNENQKIKIRLGGLLCGKTKIRFGLASDLQKSGTKIRLGCLGCLPKNGKNQRFVSLGVLLKNNQRFVYTNT